MTKKTLVLVLAAAAVYATALHAQSWARPGPGSTLRRAETCLKAVEFEASVETAQIRPVGLPGCDIRATWTMEGDENETFVLVVAVREPRSVR